MSSRRCGVPDIINTKPRKRRYIFGSEGWTKRNLTFFVANWTPRLGKSKVVKNIQKALETWGSYGRLNFQYVQNQEADIVVTFVTKEHGDSFPFDGPGGILAHAFFPYEGSDIGGDIHFDAEEMWVDTTEGEREDGTEFYSVALHELGHSLGLAHSPVPSSVMFPYYKHYDASSVPQLDYDDILGMYNLYINRILKEEQITSSTTTTDDFFETFTILCSTEATERWYSQLATDHTTFTHKLLPITPSASTPTSTDDLISSTVKSEVTYEGDDESVDDHKEHDNKHNIPHSPSLPNICDGYVDAIATFRDELFVFKEQFIWRYKEKGKLEPRYPVSIFQLFPKLPEGIKKINAAYERPDGMIVIFTGNIFWVYDGTNFVENSPKPLAYYGLPNYLKDIDAVQIWRRNKKTYFYKNDRFWRYNETAKAMDPGYPLHIERWRGVPENIDAATTWNDGITYFFKGELFWTFDNNWVMTTEQSPLPTAEIWFGCPEEEHKMARLFTTYA